MNSKKIFSSAECWRATEVNEKGAGATLAERFLQCVAAGLEVHSSLGWIRTPDVEGPACHCTSRWISPKLHSALLL